MGVPINYLAVLVCAFVSMFVGYLWYGPFFGKAWMKLMNISQESMKGAGKSYAVMFVTSLVTAYVLAHAIVFGIAYTHIDGASGGAVGAFYYWLGFVVPIVMGGQLWEKKPWKLFWIQAGYYLVSLVIQGAILAVWT